MADIRPLALLLSDPDDAMWRREEVGLVMNVRPKSVYNIPGLPRIEIPGRGRRGMTRWRAGDVRQYLKDCRAGEGRVA